ncbi:Uncharacterized DUF218 membrane protein [hydrothermal vent metagenome]|uniref:Uncharacterized DUF218 membrane protein n=1 Tax=hydrothermal vent metagenome TaxID=652676 RepID=A0A3B0ZD46_9ZZZZ
MEIVIGHIMEAFFMPPGLMLILVIIGWQLQKRFFKTGRILIVTGLGQLIILSLPLVSNYLIQHYESQSALTTEQIENTTAEAIVILGGGHYFNAPEYQKDSVSTRALERLRYGVHIQRITNLPILLSGGTVYSSRKPESEIMKDFLQTDCQAKVKWIETKSRTTYENAVETQKILDGDEIRDILLVTQAWHMPRAKEAFEKHGFTVTAAPVGFHTDSDQPFILTIIPSTMALHATGLLWRELIARFWYRLVKY